MTTTTKMMTAITNIKVKTITRLELMLMVPSML